MAAAAVGVTHVVAQSVAFARAPGSGLRHESDLLYHTAPGAALERIS